MRVVLTGGTGCLGSAIAAQLVGRGHAVSGQARSDRSAATLATAGVAPLRGDLALLREAAQRADGVVHAGFSHDDWDRMDAASAQDERAVAAMPDALAGTAAPLVYTSGSGVMADTGSQEAEEDAPLSDDPGVARRIVAERQLLRASARGVMIRPGHLFGRGGSGVVPLMIDLARHSGMGRTVGDGANAWSAVHMDDVAQGYALAREQALGGETFHLAAGEPIEMRALAPPIGTGLGQSGAVETWPLANARTRLGLLADGLAANKRIDAAKAERVLGWRPAEPSLFEDLAHGSHRAALAGNAA